MAVKIRGIAFPFQRGPNGIPATTEDAEAVKSDLLLLFNTTPQSRVMRPSLSVDVARIVFDNTGPLLNAFLVRSVAEAIGRFEPRVDVLNIGISESETTVTVDVEYEVFGDADTLTMIYSKQTGSLVQAS